jgi:hypothetical protein
MTQAEIRSYREQKCSGYYKEGAEGRDKAESWRENQRKREDAEKGKFGGKEERDKAAFEEGKNMARAQEIAICGSSESAGYQSNPIRPVLREIPSPAITSPKVVIPARTTRCDESMTSEPPRTTTSRVGMARLKRVKRGSVAPITSLCHHRPSNFFSICSRSHGLL